VPIWIRVILTPNLGMANSTPFPLAFEKFYLPDTIRVVDSVIETVQY
jgi:hypothetical protein